MKILFLGPYKSSEFLARYGHPSDSSLGGQRKIPLILRALLTGGNEIKVVSSAVSPVGGRGFQVLPTHEERFPEGLVQVISAPTIRPKPWGGLLISFSSMYRAWSVARAWKPDILFLYNGLLPEALGMRAVHFSKRIPAILEIEDLPGVRLHKLSPKSILDRTFWTMVLRRTSAFLLVNSKLIEKLPIEDRPVLLLAGLIEKKLIDLAASRRPPFTGSKFVLMYAGGLTVERGVGVLLEAVPKLPPNWQLVVSGGGPLIGAIKELSLKYPGQCKYLGFLSVEELYQEMTKADVLINTPEKLSDQSGVFPFKICEYLVSGSHVISSKLPSLEGCDIGLIQRWSGVADDLPALLLRSADDFKNETLARQNIANWVVRSFGMRAVSRSLNDLFARCRPSP